MPDRCRGPRGKEKSRQGDGWQPHRVSEKSVKEIDSIIEVKRVDDPEEKTRVTLAVMQALPQWFSPPEDILKKSRTHRAYPFFAAYDGGEAVGFVAVKCHNRYTADVYTLGVLQPYHRQGVGGKLLDAVCGWCRAEGYIYLTVKTLDESADYAPYDQTRAFYKKQGFLPLEVFLTFWDAENPCLFMVKSLWGDPPVDK